MSVLAPRDQAELVEAIRDAAATGAKIDLRGGGSKSGTGAPVVESTTLDMRAFAGVADYDPAELVLTVGAGTPLADVESLVARHDQMLAFEPFDFAQISGGECGRTTIGGVVVGAVSGPRRLSRGAVRDHLLGFSAVSGRGEAFVAGGKVVKNVTGYDLSKLMAGSWGRLAALTEVTLKVLPAPQLQMTFIVRGLDAGQAYRAMSTALASQADVAAAAYLPEAPDDGPGDRAVTAFRLEGFAPSVAARAIVLDRVLGGFGRVEQADPADGLWDRVRSLAPLATASTLWRVSLPARSMPSFSETLAAARAPWLADWGGGLVWTGFAGEPAILRRAAAEAGGHAALVKGFAELRAAVPAFHPQAAGLAALEQRVRRGFDPLGVFETGRFG